ncbi:uncharacterized protein LOC141641511 [Silene latifolia]|uniref:uncharacterized protein LOC141641511 n=1 Tax=Silene latifolia TaxID=37657 RepID=UPI003D7745B3
MPEYHLDDGLVEDVEEESDTEQEPVDQNKEDDIWYQRHGRKIMQIVEENDQDLLELSDDDVQSELEYWQQAVFGFIVGANPSWQILEGLIGLYIKSDTATEHNTRLGFARVIVELKLVQSFPNKVKFLDEKKNLIEVGIEYEWKPSICTKYKQIGHEQQNCRKGKPKLVQKASKQVWRPVKKNPVPVAIPQQEHSRTTIQKIVIQQPAAEMTPPATKIPDAMQYIVSPVKQLRTKQGLENVSKNGPHSPNYMEVLSPSNSPRQGIGISETKVKPNNLNKAMRNVFHELSISTNTTYHKGGRIWILWKPHLYDIQFMEYNAQYIHMYIVNKSSQAHFFHTIIYAFNGITERESLWLNIKRLAGSIQEPWSVGGDFNCVLQANERLRGQVSIAESAAFQVCLDWCQLMDIKASGAFFTWNNKQPSEARKYSRLDMFFVNQDWMDQMPEFFCQFPS